MINKYLIIVIFIIIINISCKREISLNSTHPTLTPKPVNNVNLTTPTPKPVNNVNLTSIKDYVFIDKYRAASQINDLNVPKYHLRHHFTLDPEGNIYLHDRPNITKFDSQGKFITKWFCEGKEEYIEGITVCNKNIYAIDTNIPPTPKDDPFPGFLYNHIQIYNLHGKFITRWDPKGIFFSIKEDKEGNIYLAGTSRTPCSYYEDTHISKYDSNGSFKFMFKLEDLDIQNLNLHSYCITDIVIDSSGYIYISACLDEKKAEDVIIKCDSSGKFITKWLPTYKEGDTVWWSGLGIDLNDNIYVANRGVPCSIEKYDSNGNFITKFGSNSDEEELYLPEEVAVDSMGNVYVLDTGSIKKFAPVLNKLNKK